MVDQEKEKHHPCGRRYQHRYISTTRLYITPYPKKETVCICTDGLHGGMENELGRLMREELADTHRGRTGETTTVEWQRAKQSATEQRMGLDAGTADHRKKDETWERGNGQTAN